MEDRTKAPGTQSRRTFTKTIAAALVAAPFTSSPAGAAAGEIKGPTSAGLASPTAPLSSVFAHLPITVTGGSFHLEVKDEIIRTNPPGPPLPPPLERYHRLARAQEAMNPYDNIAEVQVQREHPLYLGSWEETLWTYTLATPAKLRIWLQRWRGPGKYDFDPVGAAPDVIIKGDPFEVFIHRDFDNGSGPRRTHKKYREYLYEAHLHGSGRGYRIRKYDIVRLDDTAIPGFSENPPDETDVPDFRFMVTFLQDHELFFNRENIRLMSRTGSR